MVAWWVVGVPLLPVVLAVVVPVWAVLYFALDKYNQYLSPPTYEATDAVVVEGHAWCTTCSVVC